MVSHDAIASRVMVGNPAADLFMLNQRRAGLIKQATSALHHTAACPRRCCWPCSRQSGPEFVNYASSPNSDFASCKSLVSKPSVNQP
jgi:hypothetical protein